MLVHIGVRAMEHSQALNSRHSMGGRSVDLRPRQVMPYGRAASTRSPANRRGRNLSLSDPVDSVEYPPCRRKFEDLHLRWIIQHRSACKFFLHYSLGPE